MWTLSQRRIDLFENNTKTLLMYKPAILSVLLLILNISIIAQTEDDNIIITNKNVTYEYVIDKGKVVVKEKYIAEYEATRLGGKTYTYEMYDNESTIDKARVKGIKLNDPKYTQYSSNDIFYSDAKICEISLFFDKKGKKGSVEFEKTIKDPRYFPVISLSDDLFVRNKTVKIILPSWMKAEFVECNFGSNIKKEVLTDPKSSQKTYVYTIQNLDPIPNEPMMQGYTYNYPHIMILNKSADIEGVKTTFFETLSDQYKWYKHLVGQMNNDKSIIASKAKEITAKSNTEIGKIKDIFAWVQTNIRYLAFVDGIAGFKPDDAQEVLRKKYGDCKGMANLTKTLLESLGFDARLTWIGTNHIVHDYSIPNLSVDNHMICTVFFEGKTYYLDATYEYMPLGEYPQSIQGRQVMIENGDDFILNRIPVFEPQLNTDSLYCEFKIDGDKLIGQGARYFKGESKERILSLINATPKDKIDEALRTFIENANIQDKASDITLNGASPKTEATFFTYKLENRSSIQTLDKDIYIGMNQTQDFINSTIDVKKRKSNLLLNYRHRQIRETELLIPYGYTITHTPKNMKIDREGYIFSISYTQKENKLFYRSEILIKDPLIKKVDFNQWNSDIEELRKNYMEQVVLTAQ